MAEDGCVEIRYRSGPAVMTARLSLTSTDAFSVLSYAQSLGAAYTAGGALVVGQAALGSLSNTVETALSP